MESSRLKNIIILILALLNVCLLASLGLRLNAEQTSQRQARRQLAELFAVDGVALDDSIIPDEDPPAGLNLAQDQEEDRALAAFLLEETLSVSDRGGGIYQYSSNHGAALFRSNGSFDAYTSLYTGQAEEVCREFCETFGYDDLVLTLEEDGTGLATAVQYYGGYPVPNCTVTFVIEEGRVQTVNGTHLPGSSTAIGNGEPLSALSALTAFLNARRATGATVTAVTDLYLCYELQSTVASPMNLVPAWCIVTDIADYYVNCITGAVTST